MNCRTLKEKWSEAWSEFVRWFKIITISVVFAALLGVTFAFALTLRENKELKNKIEYMEVMEANSKTEESNKGRTKYVVVVDEMTGEIIYTDYR